MSNFLAVLHSVFSFRTRSVTVLAVLFYLAIFVSLYVTDLLAPVPGTEKQAALGLDLEEAYRDLHVIAASPRPYNSHQNDRVRAYLLDRLAGITKDRPFIHVLDDNTTSAFLDGKTAVYFQGNNILVKVDGTEESKGEPSHIPPAHRTRNGILFSAHLDSVSTAPGATDDGMSVVALLQMVDHLAHSRPKRTAVFNLNNGEEDGLHGAHSFLAHPWSNLTSTFINFEGAGAGGRPLLFRTTSLPILNAFTHAHIPHPHADALSADAFAQGVIRSETDYAVYSSPRRFQAPSSGSGGLRPTANGTAIGVSGYKGLGGGMRGADVAFYQHRARYHTSEDSIRAMGREGARRSLWAVMEVVRGAGAALLDADEGTLGEAVPDHEAAAYFELFRTYLIAMPLRTLMAIFVVLLVAGPIVLGVFGFFLYRQSTLAQASQTEGRWITGLRGYGRFWLALLITITVHVGLVLGYLKLNPYTIHAHDLAVVLSMLSLSYLSFALPLSLAHRLRPIPPAKQKLVVLVELYILTWILLIGAAAAVGTAKIAGVYWVGAWNASMLVAAVIAMVEGLGGKGHAGRQIVLSTPPPQEEEGDAASSERTPLIPRAAPSPTPPPTIVDLDEKVQDRAVLWWVAQMVFTVPVPVLQLGNILFLWVRSMAQTVPDGGWVGIIYAPTSLLSILLLLPLTPFAHKLHRSLTTLVLALFVLTTAYAWLAWPFTTSDARLKVFFAHHVELANITTPATGPLKIERATTELTALAGYVDRVVHELPSSWTARARPGAVQCAMARRQPGLRTCAWALDEAWHPSLSPSPAGGDEAEQEDGAKAWIVANVTRVERTEARFRIRGAGTRACRVYLDNRAMKRVRARAVHVEDDGRLDEKGGEGGEEEEEDGGEEEWRVYEVPEGVQVREARLWSRTWGSEFEVEIEFGEGTSEGTSEGADADRVEGRVACTWAEFRGGWTQAGVEMTVRKPTTEGPAAPAQGVRIPALEEVLAFMPEWAAVTKLEDGLVEAQSGFVI
ncbi:hypothetical protein OF83DRAFT_1069216 [Amylostereum chailletii]|nr:hypothetical protein OF83DRAFT_1069216 [Amylostereum chailletii]